MYILRWIGIKTIHVRSQQLSKSLYTCYC